MKPAGGLIPSRGEAPLLGMRIENPSNTRRAMTADSIVHSSAAGAPLEKVPLETYVPPAKPSLIGLSRAENFYITNTVFWRPMSLTRTTSSGTPASPVPAATSAQARPAPRRP